MRRFQRHLQVLELGGERADFLDRRIALGCHALRCHRLRLVQPILFKLRVVGDLIPATSRRTWQSDGCKCARAHVRRTNRDAGSGLRGQSCGARAALRV